MNADDDGLLSDRPPDGPRRRCRKEHACSRQAVAFDDGRCMEVFRRAIEERDERCWHALVATLDDLVRGWCRRSAGARAMDLDELVCLTWEKFWRNYTADKLRAATCSAQVFGYLKMCARSIVIDAARGRFRPMSLDPRVVDNTDAVSCVAERHVSDAARAALWQMIAGHLKDDRERVLVHLRYEVGLTPAEAQAARPDLFPSIGDLYAVTRRVLDRLRRSVALRAWLADQC